MATTFSSFDLELLGYQSARELTPNGAKGYVVYEAVAKLGLETRRSTFVYLQSDCTVDQLSDASAAASKGFGTVYILHAKSFKSSKQTLVAKFGANAKILVHEDLVWNTLKDLFGDYLESIKRDVATEQYYIPPRKESALPDHRLDEEMLAYLQGKGTIRPGELAVVCAPAAVGKTTLSRQLLRKLVDGVEGFRIVPIYVESSHWGRLHLDSAEDLWEVIRNSISTFSSRLSIGRELFEHVLKQGYVCFIFDGFDELCGHRSARFNPNELLQDLARIAARSEARIVLTTRTLYWNSEIVDPPENVKVVQLAPFNTQQAKGYFRLFFHADAKAQQRASDLYSDVVGGALRPANQGGARAQFVNLPVCVVMISQFVQAGGELLKAVRPGRLMEEILQAICEREVARKKLITKSKDQLVAFETIAIEEHASASPEFDLGLLEAAGIVTEDVPKLIDHPLLAHASSGAMRFCYEFLSPFFKATFLERFLSTGKAVVASDVWKVMSREANGKGFILEHLVSLLPSDCLGQITAAYEATPPAQRDARSFLIHLARLVIEDDTVHKTAADRTAALLPIFGASFDPQSRTLSGVTFVGPLEGLAFSGLTFERCSFRDVSFNRSTADRTTRFTRCSFSGELTIPTGVGEWADVELNHPTFVAPANLAWESILGAEGANREQNVRDAMKLALDKVWHHGRLKGSITKGDWGRGLLAHTRYAKPILEAMLKLGLMNPIEISNVPQGGYAFDRSSIPDLQRFMDNRHMTGKIRKLYDMLMDV